MTSGINGWEGHQAAGGEKLGLEYFIQGDFDSAAQMAYNMEMGLQQFYQLLADRSESEENKDLLELMARLEDSHMAKLRAQYSDTELDKERQIAAVAEGGIRRDEFMATYGDQLQDIESIIQTGMMFETQAYDMYSRLARKSEKPELREFYLQMAAEERRHLNTLASELEKRLG